MSDSNLAQAVLKLFEKKEKVADEHFLDIERRLDAIEQRLKLGKHKNNNIFQRLAKKKAAAKDIA